MSSPIRTVLITGCSDGGLGAALAVAFHEAGLHVYATARSVTKMTQMTALGIQTMPLDVLSDVSIAACVSKVPSLDILVNNAGKSYSMPVSDISIPDAKRIFDLNVWAYIAVTQAFLPHLLKTKGMIVNQTSVTANTTIPFQSVYNASKAAIAMFSDTERLELKPFGVKVIELKTGVVLSNLIKNQKEQTNILLPEDSIYHPAREAVEATLRFDTVQGTGTPAKEWAAQVVQDLLKNRPPLVIWRGAHAMSSRIGTLLPHGMLDGTMKKMTRLDIIEEIVRS